MDMKPLKVSYWSVSGVTDREKLLALMQQVDMHLTPIRNRLQTMEILVGRNQNDETKVDQSLSAREWQNCRDVCRSLQEAIWAVEARKERLDG